MASLLTKQPQHRQPTKANSASSASVVTVQRATSSRNGSKSTPSGLKPQSPSEINFNPVNHSIQTLSPDTRRRSSAAWSRSDSGNGVREGVGNLNRWSQSTVSSNSSATHNRRGSFSKRLSGSFGAFAHPHSSSSNAKGVGKVRPSASISPEESSKLAVSIQTTDQPPVRYPPTLPPIVTLSSLTQAVDAADSPSTAATATPATADLLSPGNYPSDPDYFGSRWRPRSPLSQQDPGLSAQKIAPVPSPKTIAASSRHSPQHLDAGNESTLTSTDRAVSKYSQRGSIQQKKRRREQHPTDARGLRDGNRGTGSAGIDTQPIMDDRHARSRRVPSQKAMLSKALQKAKHAVLLDNAQNFEGAMDAYGDACALLQSVMQRSSGDEYLMKLESVTADGKALPRRPGGRDSSEQEPISPLTDEEDDVITIGNATAARVVGAEPIMTESRPNQDMGRTPIPNIPPRRHSLRPPASRLENQSPQIWNNSLTGSQPQYQQSFSTQSVQRPNITRARTLEPAINYQRDMPPPLSPRRLHMDNPPPQNAPPPPLSTANPIQPSKSPPERPNHHTRHETAESTSWLDTIDESGGSSASSVHSRTSSIGLRRKRIRAASGATEAEFDAALDAAVEAAYDDGFEPADDDYYGPEDIPDAPYEQDDTHPFTKNAKPNIELAKEQARESEREATIAAAKDREKKRLQQSSQARDSSGSGTSDAEADEEERMLEEMTRGYVLDSEYNVQSKSALPRQSDSSSFSGRTWGSSIGSNPTSAGTSFSVAAGAPALPSLPAELQGKQMPPPAYPPPSGALPNLPSSILNGNMVKSPSGAPPTQRASNLGVRERRLSGLKAGQLKIETSAKVLSASVAPAPKSQPAMLPAPLSTSSMTEPPKSAFAVPEAQQALPGLAISLPANTIPAQATVRKGSSPLPGPGSAETTPNIFPPMPSLHPVATAESEDSVPSVSGSPARLSSKSSAGPGALRKNFSSSSLKKMLTNSVPEPPETGNSSVTVKQRRPPATAVPTMPTPKGANFVIEAIPSGGIHLFDSEIHSAIDGGTPNPLAANAPSPLEPCPESSLLRPFWFLRCVYQSITHPRGAYLSTRLFVPRDIWKVTNVKLKNVDEKVSSCDLLTATLLNLAKVNTFDANAVLEEMQNLEQIMDQSQAVLSKKLGSEVGVSSATWNTKGSGETASNGDVLGGRNSSAGSKFYLSSWRKKMSKNSSAGSGFSAINGSQRAKDGDKEGRVMSSVPMTDSQHSRFARRELSEVEYVGPHSHYMGALARLCESAQFLDQIARGVEDPGLKHSSPTHVGLELSMRHAAEFFGFYICRFILNDITMMLDKFIKRGSQWVLA
ncbi:MAG: hypothetical protein Q9219_006377 [cf. Caloplaca sp. 3 TL-2023]